MSVVIERDGARLQVTWPAGHPHWAAILKDVKAASQDLGGRFVKSKKCWEFALGDLEHVQNRLSLYSPVLGPNAREWQASLLQPVNTDIELPEVPYEYKRHQIEGVRYLMANSNFILLDEMGLGKSLQAATAFYLRKQSGAVEKALIICPNNVKHVWLDELKYCFPDIHAVIYKDSGSLFYADVIIINYEKMWRVVDELVEWEPDMVIADEVHRCKNRDTHTAKALAKLQPKFRGILSGTLLTNKPEDVWFPINWVVPGYFPDYWQFVRTYATFGGYGGYQITGYRNLPQLRERIRQISLRRTKAEVLDMPPRTFQVRRVEMTAKQRALYETCRLGILTELTADGFAATPNALTKTLRLAQIASNPRLVGEDYEEVTAKYDTAVEIIDECEGQVVVLSCYRYDVKRMKEILGEDAKVITGQTPIDERAEIIKEFQAGRFKTLLVSTKAVKEGVTLTAASTMIYLNRSWNAEDRMQSLDRNYRIGQTRTCTVIDLVVPGTMDEATYDAIKGKQAMANYLQSQTAAQERDINQVDLRKYLERAAKDA